MPDGLVGLASGATDGEVGGAGQTALPKLGSWREVGKKNT